MLAREARDYIVFALDVPTARQAETLVDELKQEVGMFKVGLELFINSGPDFVRHLTRDKQVGVFLDLKLHDIPVTVARAMERIAGLGVSMTTVHCGENRAMLDAAVQAAAGRVRIMGVTVLTSVGDEDLRHAGFAERFCGKTLELVKHRAEMALECGCDGVICSGQEVAEIKRACGNEFLAVVPGIRPADSEGNDDQRRTVTPAQAVAAGADYLVVGRPIRDAARRKEAARSIARQVDQGLSGL